MTNPEDQIRETRGQGARSADPDLAEAPGQAFSPPAPPRPPASSPKTSSVSSPSSSLSSKSTDSKNPGEPADEATGGVPDFESEGPQMEDEDETTYLYEEDRNQALPVDDCILAAMGGAMDGRTWSEDQRVESAVAAVITVEDDSRYLPRTLEALLSQNVLPGEIIIAQAAGGKRTGKMDLGPGREIAVPRHQEGHPDQEEPCRIHAISVKAGSFSETVNAALNQARDEGIISNHVTDLLLLHDDSRPVGTSYLEGLLETKEKNPSATVIGTKQMDWADRSLRNVGYFAAPGHKVASLVVDGEEDQEQYDDRSDVFAVSLSGALVNLNQWLHLSQGPYPFSTLGQSRDFCRRVCRSGGRVIIAPQVRTAHRAARLEGVRDLRGRRVDDPVNEPSTSYGAQTKARDTYFYSDLPVWQWIFAWLGRWLFSLYACARLLGRKQVAEAGAELTAPWRDLFSLFTMISARIRVASQTSVPLRSLALLQASRGQMKTWKEKAFSAANQNDDALLNPLVRAHLAARRRVRYGWAGIMMVIALIMGLAANFPSLRSLLSFQAVSSPILLPSGASLRQVAESATTSWTYASGLGLPAAPAPFLLLLLCLCAVTGGHVAIAYDLIILLAAPFAALGFWALAGTVTRSNSIRVASSLAWVGLSILMGIYGQGNLPLLITTIFLPAGLAFTFKALGMYRTEYLSKPLPSAQHGACAALCLMVVCLCEPQYLPAFLLAYLAFFLLARSHKSYLLLIPLPSVIVLLPTVVDSLTRWGQGGWRQFFMDSMTPAVSSSGTVTAGGALIGSFARHLGVSGILTSRSSSSLTSGLIGLGLSSTVAAPLTGLLSWIVLVIVALVVLLALVSLFLPFALRLSRMVWTCVIAGVVVTLIASRTTVSFDASGSPVAGSVLPGLLMALMGLLAGTCLVAGAGAKSFTALSRKRDDGKRAGTADAAHSVALAGRGLLSFLLVLGTIAAVFIGMLAPSVSARLTPSTAQLPMVAQDYLAARQIRRILAVDASNPGEISYASMRTSRGDVIDLNPSAQARLVSSWLTGDSAARRGGVGAQDESIATALSRLAGEADSSAVASLSALGFGGIYLVKTNQGETAELISHLVSSDGTESVVSNEQGTYIRFAVDDTNTHGISLSGQTRAESSFWRKVWLWSMGIVGALYLLVAFPRRHRYSQEQA